MMCISGHYAQKIHIIYDRVLLNVLSKLFFCQLRDMQPIPIKLVKSPIGVKFRFRQSF